jgi:tetratricopeptide (TPR) repeat protein
MDDEKAAVRKKLNRMVELGRWADELWKTLPLSEAIEAIEERIRGADSDDRYTLTLDLKNLLLGAGREPEAERIIDEMIACLPDDVRFPLSKASLYLYYTDEPEKAVDAINMALDRAYRTGFSRREALGVKARILLKLGRGEQLSQTLEEIMSLEMKREIPDSRRERDFVDGAPPGMIAEDLLARYNVFCPKRGDE